jgi:iron(III) transport system substrate-binding protein
MRLPNKHRVAVTVLAVAALAVSACGSSGGSGYTLPTAGWKSSAGAYAPPADLVKEAKKEGSLVMYTGLTTGAEVAKEFTAEYGIKVKTQLFTASQLESAFQSQSSVHQYTADMIASSYDPFYSAALANGYLNPIGKEMPGFAGYYPAKFMRDGGKTPVAVILLTPIAYNTKLVKPADLPTSYQDLADPKWRGRIISTDPTTNPLLPSLYTLIAQKWGEATVTAIGKNTVRYYPANAAELQALAAGEGAIAISGAKGVTARLAKSGAPVATQQFAFGAGAEFSFMASAHAPHPAATALFLSWIYSKAGQQTANKLLYSSSPLDPGGLPSDYVVATPVTSAQVAHVNKLLGR